MDNLAVSDATKRNWAKLNTDMQNRLKSRANKTKSEKRIVPVEYFAYGENIEFVNKLVSLVLEREYEIGDVVCSLCKAMLRKRNLDNKNHVIKVLSEYDYNDIPEISSVDMPMDEYDIIGAVYQSLLKEGEKNLMGSYYTPQKITNQITSQLNFDDGQTFLDPCCGSGAFLLSIGGANPNQLYGFDNDAIAVLIAKTNMLIKYADTVFEPQIYCLEYASDYDLFFNHIDIISKKHDYVVTNPPWGSMVSSDNGRYPKESFARFFMEGYNQLKENGKISYLFPESVLNVKNHEILRKFILEKTGLLHIEKYNMTFSGVTTKFLNIECSKSSKIKTVKLRENGDCQEISIDMFKNAENNIFSFYKEHDVQILKNIEGKGAFSLDKSEWALGIVTGDNKSKIKTEFSFGLEKIYTGKEILPYSLKSSSKYINYDRSNLQQVGLEEIYRAKEKLVYKFISSKLVFAYDYEKSLFLNSANIIIPNIPNMSVKTVMAFLNSDVFQYIYQKKFNTIKVLKGNLCQLMFPEITAEQNVMIEELVCLVMDGEIQYIDCINDIIYKIYNLENREIEYIKGEISGKVRT